MRQAVCAAAATAAAAAGAAKGPALVPVGADSQASTAPHAAQQQQPHQKPTQQQQQQGESDGFRSSAPQTQQERYAEEEVGAKVQLYCPGQLWHLRRCTGEGFAAVLLLCLKQAGRRHPLPLPAFLSCTGCL
jgi:hypothetical protein